MNHATKAVKPKASMRGKRREDLAVIVRLIMEHFLVRMAQIEELQGAFKELIDLLLADFVRGEEGVKVEIRESAVSDAGREQLAQPAGIDRTELANFFEDYAAQWILKNAWFEQTADLTASSALDQDGAQEAQRVPFQDRPASGVGSRHRNRSYFVVAGAIWCRISASTRDQTAGSHSISV